MWTETTVTQLMCSKKCTVIYSNPNDVSTGHNKPYTYIEAYMKTKESSVAYMCKRQLYYTISLGKSLSCFSMRRAWDPLFTSITLDQNYFFHPNPCQNCALFKTENSFKLNR